VWAAVLAKGAAAGHVVSAPASALEVLHSWQADHPSGSPRKRRASQSPASKRAAAAAAAAVEEKEEEEKEEEKEEQASPAKKRRKVGHSAASQVQVSRGVPCGMTQADMCG
jgi:hypothetical protein